MLKMTKQEVLILDSLRGATPKVVAKKLGLKQQQVYNAIHSFRKKTQNAQDFLAVAKSQYRYVLNRRLETPKIKPLDDMDDEPLEIEKHLQEENQ